MSRTKLTQRSVEEAACPPGKKDILIFDRDLPGFGLRVGQSGSKTFLAQYATPTGKRRLPIGAFGLLTVEEARKRARATLGAVADGRDPFAEKQALATAQKAEAAAAKARAEDDAYTLRRLIDAWNAAREGDRRPGYLRTAVGTLKKSFAEWLDRPAISITASEIVRRLDQIKADGHPVAANRTLAYGRAAFSWAEKRQAVRVNPFKGLEAPTRERSRERVLTAEEIGLIWRAAGGLVEPYGAYFRVLLLTLARREEVASMRWDELDSPTHPTLWTLPGPRTKNHKPHLIHLADPVRSILTGLRRLEGCPFVFPSPSGKPVCAFSDAKEAIDAAITKHREEARIEPSAMPAWVPHDFRRSGVTHLADMGFPPHVADKLLNHVTGTIRGVAAVYQRAEFLAERKSALDAWAAFVLRAAQGRAGADNVVTLAPRAANQ